MGTPINTAVMLVAAEGIAVSKDQSVLVVCGGHIKNWAASLITALNDLHKNTHKPEALSLRKALSK